MRNIHPVDSADSSRPVYLPKYMTWPLVISALSKKSVQRLVVVLLVAAPLIRWIVRSQIGNGFTFLTFCRMDGILAGSLLALWLRSDGISISRLRKVATGLLLVGGIGSTRFLINGGQESILVYSFLAMAFAGLLCFAAVDSILPRPLRVVLNNSSLRYIGKISYGIYLFHPIVQQAFDVTTHKLRILQGDTFVQDAIALVVDVGLVIATASISWYVFEQPILRIKKRFQYARHVPDRREEVPLAAES